MSDPEGHSLSVEPTTAFPSFITVSGLTFIISPLIIECSRSITLSFDVSDSVMRTPETITLNIINDPPVFHPETTVFTVLSSYTYTTNIVDPEGHSVTITAVSGNPSFMTLQSDMRTFDISPPYNIANGSTYPVTITFTDGCNYP